MYRITTAMLALVTIAAAPVLAAHADEPPDFYLGVGHTWDLEDDSTQLSLSFSGSGSRELAPDIGLYDDRLLVGVQYMVLGTRADLASDFYGGPTAFWYDNNWGGGVILGKHLTREVIIEASYRATPDWDGEVDLSVGYGLQWPW